jgi:hypothetical protein
MREIPASVSLLLEIEARQDEVLRQLAELDERLERVLAECSAFCRPGERQTLPLSAEVAPPAAHSPSLPAVKVA